MMAIKNLLMDQARAKKRKKAMEGNFPLAISGDVAEKIVLRKRNPDPETPYGRRRKLEKKVRRILLEWGYTEDMADNFFMGLRGRSYIPALLDIENTKGESIKSWSKIMKRGLDGGYDGTPVNGRAKGVNGRFDAMAGANGRVRGVNGRANGVNGRAGANGQSTSTSRYISIMERVEGNKEFGTWGNLVDVDATVFGNVKKIIADTHIGGSKGGHVELVMDYKFRQKVTEKLGFKHAPKRFRDKEITKHGLLIFIAKIRLKVIEEERNRAKIKGWFQAQGSLRRESKVNEGRIIAEMKEGFFGFGHPVILKFHESMVRRLNEYFGLEPLKSLENYYITIFIE